MANDLTWKVESNRLTGEIQGQIRRQSYTAVRETCDAVLAQVIRLMHVPGTGRIYNRGGYSHQASSPGQAPAADTGDLIASYEVGVGMESSGPVGIVHSNSRTARALEYGSPGRNLAPRPALTPAMASQATPYQHRLEKNLQKVGG